MDELVRLLKAIAYQQNLRLDDGEALVLANQLRHVETTLYKKVYEDLLATQFIPVDSSVDPGAETYVFQMASMIGAAKIIANYADDLPSVSAYMEEHAARIRGEGVSYPYSIQDLRRAALAKVALQTILADAARLSIAQLVDDMLFQGSANYGVTGFANNANVTIFDEVTGDWSTASNEEILADVNALINGVNTAVKNKMKGTTYLMCSTHYQKVSQTYASVAAGTALTLLQMMQNAHPGVTFAEWDRLALADAEGDGPRQVFYKKDPMVLSGVVPVEFEAFPPQPKGLGVIVPCHGRCGGTVVRYPVAMGYMDGC